MAYARNAIAYAEQQEKKADADKEAARSCLHSVGSCAIWASLERGSRLLFLQERCRQKGNDDHTWAISVALAERGVIEADSAVTDNDKSWQTVELRVVH